MDTYMKEALAEAQKAYDKGEVPIGAVVVREGKIVGRGHNLTETENDPTAHAEIVAIREAARVSGGWKLPGCDLYVTCEPCPMCAGAIMLTRIRTLYIGTMDPKGGACGSVMNVPQEKGFNHYVNIETGIMQAECSDIMKRFFREIREKKKSEDLG